LICSSEEAIETFIAHCDVAARDLLLPYGDVVIVLSTVLRIKRTLDGAEIKQDRLGRGGGQGVGNGASAPRGLAQARGGCEPLSRGM
jgi:hypothetical protein